MLTHLIASVVLAHALLAQAHPQAVYDEDDPPNATTDVGRVDDDVAERPRRRGAEEPGLWGYLRKGAGLSELELAPEVQENKLPLWVALSLLSPMGSVMWAPKLAFRDAPSVPSTATALWLGALATMMTWSVVPMLILTWIAFEVGGLFPPLVLAVLILDAVWVVAFLAANFYVVPRAVLSAYSDAYKNGDTRAGPRQRRVRRAPRVVEDEDQ
ncbi:MAG: hypothetical protein AB2A00_15790 [Myxococcota bacterium]